MASQDNTDGGASVGLIGRDLCVSCRGFFCLVGAAAASDQRHGHQQGQNQSKKSFHRGFLLLEEKIVGFGNNPGILWIL